MNPGFLTRTGASESNEFIRAAEANRQAVDRRLRRSRDHFPAVLTSTDNQGRFGWTEQSFDANAARYDKPGGRTGTPEWSPAYAIGDGTGPVGVTLPVQTWLRRVLVTSERGPVYEFDWQCACAGNVNFYYGSGYGGSGVSLGCCTGKIDKANTVVKMVTTNASSCAFSPGLVQTWTGTALWIGDTFTANLFNQFAVFAFVASGTCISEESGWTVVINPVPGPTGCIGINNIFNAVPIRCFCLTGSVLFSCPFFGPCLVSGVVTITDNTGLCPP